MTSKGIAWPGEAKKYTKSSYANDQAVPPPNWHDRYPDGYTEANPIPDLSVDEHFQVWMRTAGLPTFRKLYFRNDDETMAAGEYEIEIYMSELGSFALFTRLALTLIAFSPLQTTPSNPTAEPSRSSSPPSPSSEVATLSSASPTSPSEESASFSA